jgi:hypothetical protein
MDKRSCKGICKGFYQRLSIFCVWLKGKGRETKDESKKRKVLCLLKYKAHTLISFVSGAARPLFLFP